VSGPSAGYNQGASLPSFRRLPCPAPALIPPTSPTRSGPCLSPSSSPPRGAAVPRNGPSGAWRMPSSTCSGAAAPGGCCLHSTRRGKLSTTICRKWRRDGRLRQAHDRLRASLREAEGRDRDPSGAVIESQALKGTGVGGPAWGDRNAATTGPSGSPRGSATFSGGHRRTSARRARPCGKPARP
jgi:hypothetical protein